jgi:hypothetical protein
LDIGDPFRKGQEPAAKEKDPRVKPWGTAKAVLDPMILSPGPEKRTPAQGRGDGKSVDVQ